MCLAKLDFDSFSVANFAITLADTFAAATKVVFHKQAHLPTG